VAVTRLRLLSTVVFSLFAAGWTLASTIQATDPKIIINGGQNSAFALGITDPDFPITGLHFQFISPSGTSPGTSPCVINGIDDPTCTFTNDSGVTWFTLTFDIEPSGQQPPFNCETNAFFNSCIFNATGTQVTFLSTIASGGIHVGDTFQVEVDNWEQNTGFAGTANHAPVPEPGTLALIALGIGFIARRRRNGASAAG
jgi:hypothetical protein